jgi:oligopeptide transport system substrate-binding protein
MLLSKSWARAAILGMTVLLITGACTEDEGPAEGPNAHATGGSGDAVETPGTPPSPDASIAAAFEDEGNVLDVAIREPNSLDPMRIQDPGSVLVARQLYEGLTRWNPESQEVEPAAATKIETSKDNRTFTFTLPNDATFHNGDPVTSQDFAFAFNRIALKRNGADIAYLLELVQGFDEVNAFGESNSLSGIETPNEHTLVIKLSEPYSNFPAVLSHPSLVPLPEKWFKESDNFLAEPVGNGPFELAQPFELSAPVVLRAFEDYHDDVSIEGIRFLPFPDAASSWIPFRNGQLDIAEVPASRFDQAGEEYGDDGLVPLLVGSYYGFNLDSKELSDIRVRRAINYAIDRDAIAADVYAGTLLPPRGIVPEGMPGFTHDACGRSCTYDPRKAARLVGKLPERSRSVTLEYTREEPQGKVARIVRGYLESAGLDVDLKAYRLSKYLKRLSDVDHSMYRLGWIAEYPDPDVFLSALFDSGSPDNHAAFDSKQVDELLGRAQGTVDQDKRVQLYRKAEMKILEQAPIAPLGSFRMFWAAQPGVEGVTFDMLGGFDAAPISLAS